MLSVVVPCYNEEAALPAFWERVTSACQCTDGAYELVLIDDGSKDGTWASIKKLRTIDPHVVGVRLSRNYGHQLALTAGLERALGDRILIIDADLQDPPELLAEMMRMMDDGADVVYGQRRQRRGESAFKLATAYLFYRILSWLSDIEIPRDTGDFRLINRRVLTVLNSMPEHDRFIRGMISSIGLTQRPLLYDRDERVAGQSKYPLGKMIRFAINAVTSFSTKPLRMASYLGLVIAAFCFMAIVYQIVHYFVGYTVVGWTSLVVVILFVGALQLFVLGIIGEYLGRLYTETKRRPLYVIADVIGRAQKGTTASQ
jgi:glycosyltransferase involved in cell wall biosynthesis